MPDGGKSRLGRPRAFDEHEVLERAMHLFWEKGFDTTSMSDLVRATGINSPSIYGAFGSKEQLYLRAVGLYTEIEGGLTARAMSEHGTAKAAIEAMLKQHVVLFTRFDSPRGCLIVMGAANASSAGEEVRNLLVRHRAEIGETIRARIVRAVEDGELPSSSDPAALAQLYHGFLNGLSIQISDGIPPEVLCLAIDNLMAGWGAPLGR
ncbi:TetR/AcrR family transcriptional regulator [Saccharopolyspora phatthalungensis]|nr:TetR/AcrR family transcriptional regulator [Saccharopolyspora phatthalungensis]